MATLEFMIQLSAKYFLYRHIRKDTNDVFYIGIGKKRGVEQKLKEKPMRYDVVYRRAFCSRYRNNFWKRIVGKTEYEVEILLESDDRDFIGQKEIEFIKLYGRRDLGLGTLCNMTDGSDCNMNMSKDAILRIKQTKIANGTHEKNNERLRRLAKQFSVAGKDSINGKDIYVYNASGGFIKHFYTVRLCKEFFGATLSSVSRWRDTCYLYNNHLFFSKYHGERLPENLMPKQYIKKPFISGKPITLLDMHDGAVFQFDKIKDAASFVGGYEYGIHDAIYKGRDCYKNYKIVSVGD
jgi:hypothetical protein